ncbi:MAG: hypothetical protein WCN92_00145 [Eubacteriales bacterium]
MEMETLLEEIGSYWGMSKRKFLTLSKEKIERYKMLEAKIFEFEASFANNKGLLQ